MTANRDIQPLMVRDFFLIQPSLELLAAFGFYGVGAGIAYFIGTTINLKALVLGLLLAWSMQITMSFLTAYFSLLSAPGKSDEDDLWGLSAATPKQTVLVIALVSLTACAALIVLLVVNGRMTLSVWLILVVGFLLLLAHAVPPIKLALSGFGEVSRSILLAVIFPAIGLVNQIGELHRLLGLLTFPLFLLVMASGLALCFERYAADLHYHRNTFLVRIGWQQGVTLHSLLILLAYLVFGLGSILALPARLVLAGFLSLPVGLIQMWLILRIADGNKPSWSVLRLIAWTLSLVTAYLLSLTLWTG